MFVRKNVQNIVRGSLLLLMVVMLAFPLAGTARAAEVIPGDPDAYVAEDVVIDDDLFISGRRVQIDGTVLGDVFAAGENIQINGRIDGNLFIAGQVLNVTGEITDNIFGAGYTLQLGSEADISGSVYFAGFNVQASEGSQIARNVYAAGYQAVLDGAVGRNVRASLNAFHLDGSVGGDVQLELNQSRNTDDWQRQDVSYYIPENIVILPEGLVQGENAAVLGEFDYKINRYDVSPPTVTDGDDVAGFFIGNVVRTRVGEFMALLILGFLLFTFLPGPGRRAVEEMRARPFSSMAWGLLALAFPLVLVIAIGVVIFLAILFGALTLGNLAGTILSLGGIGIAAFWTVFALIFWMVSKAIFAYLIGHSIIERVSPESLEGRWALLMILIIGLLLYEIIRAVPLLGFLTATLVILLGVGAVFQVIWTAWQSRREASA